MALENFGFEGSGEATAQADSIYRRKRALIEKLENEKNIVTDKLLGYLRDYIEVTIEDEEMDKKLQRNVDFRRSTLILYGFLKGRGYNEAHTLGYTLETRGLTSEQRQHYVIGYIMENFLYHGQVPRDPELMQTIENVLDKVERNVTYGDMQLAKDRYSFVAFDEARVWRETMSMALAM